MPTLLEQLESRLTDAGIKYKTTKDSVTVGMRSAILRIDPDGHPHFEIRDGGKSMGYRSLQQAAAMLGAPLK